MDPVVLAGGKGSGGEDFTGLVQEEEIALLQKVASLAEGLRESENSGDYANVFAILSGLGPAIDLFFEEVRVNAEDEDLRLLRHSFIREIHGLFSRYADFSAVAPGEQ